MLSKIRYIRWIHQTHNLPVNSKLSDIIIPPQIQKVNEEYLELSKKIDKVTMIIDKNIISAIIHVVKFYYRRCLISEEEVLGMKNELFSLIQRLEYALQTGKSKEGKECFIYLSDLNIESNMILFKFNKATSVHLLSSGKRPIVSTDSKMYEDQRTWINSILKFSVLITCSNELLQAEFISEQYNLIETQFNLLLNNN